MSLFSTAIYVLFWVLLLLTIAAMAVYVVVDSVCSIVSWCVEVVKSIRRGGLR